MFAAVVAACADQPSTLTSGAGGGIPANAVAGTGVGGGAPKNDPKTIFTSRVEQGLIDNCKSCHEAGGISDMPFLNPPDRYASISQWPRIIRKESTSSVLVTWAKTGSGHSGVNLDAPGLAEGLLPAVQEWLAAEAAALVEVTEDKPHTVPVAPVLGHNVVYLDQLDVSLTGVSIAFEADQVTDNTLELSGIEVFGTKTTGLHVVHPIFVVHAKNEDPSPDPIDNFSGMDAYFAEGKRGPLGSGLIVLTNWKPEAKISIVFDVAEAWTDGGGEGGGGGGSVGGGCKALGSFQANAKPALQPCLQCHNTGGPGNNAVDMSGLANSDDADACAQVLNRVDPANPPDSFVFTTTDPSGNATHPFKFMGSQANFNDFEAALTIWITAEQ